MDLKNDPWTVILTSYQRFTSLLMPVCAEYVTDMKGAVPLPCCLSVPPSAFLLFQLGKGKHVLIFIDYYQSQTPCKQKDEAGAALQQRRSLCEHKHASEPQQLGNPAATQHTASWCVQTVSLYFRLAAVIDC